MSVQTVIFDTDWDHEWPLWSETGDEEPLLYPEDLGLSPSLTNELRHFYDYWKQHDLPDHGRDRPSTQQHAIAEAE